MTLKGKHALVTGSSRGIGRGIALKLAEKGAHVAVHFYQNEDAAKATLAKIRECGSDGFLVQADVCHHEEISRIFKQVETEFGSLDIFVSNARTEAPTFYQPPMEITLDKWDTALTPKPRLSWWASARPRAADAGGRQDHRHYLCTGRAVRKLAAVGGDGSRESGDEGADSLFCRRTGWTWNHCEHDQPRLDRGQRAEQPAVCGSGRNPRLAQGRVDTYGAIGDASRRWERGRAAVLRGSELDHGTAN